MYLDRGQSLIVLGACRALCSYALGKLMKFSRELPKNRRRTEVPVSYSGSRVRRQAHKNFENLIRFARCIRILRAVRNVPLRHGSNMA
jgi:hypothetical protein